MSELDARSLESIESDGERPLPPGVAASVAGLDAPGLQRALARVGVMPSPGALLEPE